MPVDPQIQQLLDTMASMGGEGIETMSPVEARALYKSLVAVESAPVDVASVDDRVVPGPHGEIPVRVYRPDGDGPHGALVWLHGGGWVIGDVETADPSARRLCDGSRSVVVSVDYRLAPEHPAPAPLDDCWAVLQWLVDRAAELGVDPSRLAVGGDSAGGNLAAVIAQRAAARGGPELALQLLVYPATDLTLSSPSMEENGEGYLLTKESMGWFIGHYLSGGADAHDPAISPLFADDVSGVAPAVVITAEYDPLRDEGEAYAAKLQAAGVPTEVRRYDGMVHGFFGMGAVTPVADEAAALASSALRRALSAVKT